ncbi:MAG: COX15/CtaA family protein [Curvibacter lanceolatus]|jgi:cytochrome c oxidase assembly protein subunit 15|uniref:COX15/CtaA family protein n=1 Tax=Curvibacter lanceolatus TaxID=86182 RepID=UPI00039F904B|nr:COX15/CtaA family protein [Curvibacter lanceolatus]MBV5292991.1 COX15/CtaA family protein [Curvibacter lanceolatus]
MNTLQPAYDLSPLLQVMLMGALVASGPLLWWWLRHRGSNPQGRLQALTLVTLFLTFDLVLFGAFTRLTDSGLGCPDWPGCYGHASPLGAQAPIAQAQQAMPTGPVTHGKAWVEMVHRYLATGVGALIVVQLALAWRRRREMRRQGRRGPGLGWPVLTLLWVCLQGAFGALTVTMKLFPAIVTLHLAGGLILLVLLAVQVARNGLAEGTLRPVSVSSGLYLLTAAAALLLTAQVLLGGWVSTNYAVLACSSFPQCQGQWWPEMDWTGGFELWRPLGQLANGEQLTFAALTAIHVAHRLAAGVVLLCLGALSWRLWQVPALRGQARWLAALLLLQALTGLSNVVLGWPLVAAVAHTGGAAALALVLTRVLTLSSPRGAYSSSVSLSASRLSA